MIMNMAPILLHDGGAGGHAVIPGTTADTSKVPA
jgi:hypothetical protein